MTLPNALKHALSVPAIGAPMFLVSFPPLVSALCRAGGTGRRAAGPAVSLGGRGPALGPADAVAIIHELQAMHANMTRLMTLNGIFLSACTLTSPLNGWSGSLAWICS